MDKGHFSLISADQVGKRINNPAMKRVAELMNMIAVVTIIRDDNCHRIIVYFGKHALDIYGLASELQRVDIDHSNYKNLLHWCEI